MTLKDWNIALSYSSDISDMLPLLAWLITRKRNDALNILGAYFLFSFPLKLITVWMATKSMNTHPFYHILAPLEFFFLYLYYCKVILINRNGIWIPLVIILSFNILNSLWLQHFLAFNSNAWSVNTLVLLFLALVYLYKLYVNIEDIKIEKHPGFIINAGFLFYFSGSIFTYILSAYILTQESGDFFANGWIIQSMANLSKNIVVSFGIWLARYW
jgi:hypothetical protein